MKKLFALLLLPLSLCLSACKTTPRPDPGDRTTILIKAVAFVTAAEYLRTHPETRPAWQTVHDTLVNLERATEIDIADVISVLRLLPVKEFQGPQFTIIVTGVVILLQEAGGVPVSVEKPSQVAAFVKGIREGLELALR